MFSSIGQYCVAMSFFSDVSCIWWPDMSSEYECQEYFLSVCSVFPLRGHLPLKTTGPDECHMSSIRVDGVGPLCHLFVTLLQQSSSLPLLLLLYSLLYRFGCKDQYVDSVRHMFLHFFHNHAFIVGLRVRARWQHLSRKASRALLFLRREDRKQSKQTGTISGI